MQVLVYDRRGFFTWRDVGATNGGDGVLCWHFDFSRRERIFVEALKQEKVYSEYVEIKTQRSSTVCPASSLVYVKEEWEWKRVSDLEAGQCIGILGYRLSQTQTEVITALNLCFGSIEDGYMLDLDSDTYNFQVNAGCNRASFEFLSDSLGTLFGSIALAYKVRYHDYLRPRDAERIIRTERIQRQDATNISSLSLAIIYLFNGHYSREDDKIRFLIFYADLDLFKSALIDNGIEFVQESGEEMYYERFGVISVTDSRYFVSKIAPFLPPHVLPFLPDTHMYIDWKRDYGEYVMEEDCVVSVGGAETPEKGARTVNHSPLFCDGYIVR